MSYEGYVEYLCVKGHHQVTDCNSDTPTECFFCKQPLEFYHPVDVTNGYNEEHASCCDAPKVEVGFDDDWKQDHHGNKYAIKVERYLPGSPAWRSIKAERESREAERLADEQNRRWLIKLSPKGGDSWNYVSDYDAVTRSFRVTTNPELRYLRLFKEKIEADKAAAVIFATFKDTPGGWESVYTSIEVCPCDLRDQ